MVGWYLYTNFRLCMSVIEIIQKISDGYRVKEISVEMNVEVKEIDFKLRNQKEITGCKTLAHLVANFIRRGLIK